MRPRGAPTRSSPKVNDVKGRFAQELAAVFADEDVTFTIPDYLAEAIAWVAERAGRGGAG